MAPSGPAETLQRLERVVVERPPAAVVDIELVHAGRQLASPRWIDPSRLVRSGHERLDLRPPGVRVIEMRMGLVGTVPGKAVPQRIADSRLGNRVARLVRVEHLHQTAPPHAWPVSERAVEVPEQNPAIRR